MHIVQAKDLKVGDNVSSAEKRYHSWCGDEYERRGVIQQITELEIQGVKMLQFRSDTNRWSCSPTFPFAVNREPWVDPYPPIPGRQVFGD